MRGRIIRDASRLSSPILLARVRARLGLTVRPCDLQKLLRKGDNAYKLLDRLAECRYATKTRTIDVGKGTLLYTLAESRLIVQSRSERKYVTFQWKAGVTFVPGWPCRPGEWKHKPAAGKVTLVGLRKMVGRRRVVEQYVVRVLGSVPDGWLVRLEETAPFPHRTNRRRRRKPKPSTEG